MRELLASNSTHFLSRKPAYDGRKGFYTAGPLTFTSKDFVVTLVDKDDQGSVR
jgi:eukaryotic translation initiation factor 2C